MRAAALEALLTEKGLVSPEFIDSIVAAYVNDIGPMNGAKVVARAWVDREYRQRLLADGTAAIAELGFGGPEGEHMVVVENTPEVHNVVVCTLCSCYPWPVLGLPPNWYKSPPYRARMVREPRNVLAEMGDQARYNQLRDQIMHTTECFQTHGSTGHQPSLPAGFNRAGERPIPPAVVASAARRSRQ